MKKVLFLIVLVMGFGINASAQNHFDIKAGIGGASFSGDDSDATLNWKIGAGYEMRLSNLIGIEPSVFLNSKGAKSKESDSEFGDVACHVLYAEVPVMVNFHVGAGWVIGAGVYGAYRLGVNASASKVSTYNDELSDLFKACLKKGDAGIKFGVKHDFDNGLFLGLDGSIGCMDITNSDKKSGIYIEDSESNITASFNIGYRF